MEIIYRRHEVSRMYLEGIPQFKIAEKFGLSTGTIAQDLVHIRDQWKASTIVNFEEKLGVELAKIDHLEDEAWEAWQKSKESAEIVHRRREYVRQNLKGKGRGRGKHKLVPIKVTAEKVAKGQVGDPRFLDQVKWCVEMRCRLLGLDKAKGKTPAGIDWDALMAGIGQDVPDPLEEKLIQLDASSVRVVEESTPHEPASDDDDIPAEPGLHDIPSPRSQPGTEGNGTNGDVPH